MRKKKERFQSNKQNYDVENVENEIKNMQTKHDNYVVDIVYAREIQKTNEIVQNMRQKYRCVNKK